MHMDTSEIQKSFDFSGKVAVVTGGAGVLGAAICRALAEAGAKVAVLDLDSKAASILAAAICSNGGEAVEFACNVVEKETLEAAAQEVLAKFGRVDFLVNS